MTHTCTSCGGRVNHQAQRVDILGGAYRHFDWEDCSSTLRWMAVPDVVALVGRRGAYRAARAVTVLEPGDDEQQQLWLAAIDV